MTNFQTVSKRLITLAWNDIEPKVAAYFASGAAVTAIIGIFAAYNITVPDYVSGILVLVIGAVGGWFKKTAIKVPVSLPAVAVPLPGAGNVAADPSEAP